MKIECKQIKTLNLSNQEFYLCEFEPVAPVKIDGTCVTVDGRVTRYVSEEDYKKLGWEVGGIYKLNLTIENLPPAQ